MTRLVYSRSSLPGEQFMGQPYWWHHYLVIEDQRVTVINMKQALLEGMNYGAVDVQDGEAWSRMSAENIVAWKISSGDNRLREVPEDEAARVLAWLDSRP